MSEISAKTGILLAYSMLKGVGPAMLRRISTIPDFEILSVEEVADQLKPVRRAIEAPNSWTNALVAADFQLDQAERYNARILSPFDPDYPELLANTKGDPFLLYVRGKLAPTPSKSIAIIGTREPTAHGQMSTARLTGFFGDQGWSIVSGLALGCDGVAHSAALENGAHTVAVLAHGLHTVSPNAHKNLAEKILESGGALVSQYPFGENVQKAYFVQRDRTQAGLARGVVMMQSDIKGGSLHAARAALDFHRWLIVPYPTSNDRDNNEPKVQANLLLADGPESKKIDLLQSHGNGLNKLMIIRNKDEYPLMLENLQTLKQRDLGQTCLI